MIAKWIWRWKICKCCTITHGWSFEKIKTGKWRFIWTQHQNIPMSSNNVTNQFSLKTFQIVYRRKHKSLPGNGQL